MSPLRASLSQGGSSRGGPLRSPSRMAAAASSEHSANKRDHSDGSQDEVQGSPKKQKDDE
jgi:hypothetical protein